MTAPLSIDLRLRVVRAIENGLSRRAAAAKFDVSIASAVRWHQRYRRTGSVEPDAVGGDRHSHRAEAHAARMLGWIDENRDITLVEIADRLAGEGHVFAPGHDLAAARPPRLYGQKKTAHATEQDRPDVKAAREAWFEKQLELEPERLIFLDECGTNTKMARLYGRSKRGERCRAAIPHGHWKTTTLVAGLATDGIIAPMVMDGAMDGEMFSAYDLHVDRFSTADYMCPLSPHPRRQQGCRSNLVPMKTESFCLVAVQSTIIDVMDFRRVDLSAAEKFPCSAASARRVRNKCILAPVIQHGDDASISTASGKILHQKFVMMYPLPNRTRTLDER